MQPEERYLIGPFTLQRAPLGGSWTLSRSELFITKFVVFAGMEDVVLKMAKEYAERVNNIKHIDWEECYLRCYVPAETQSVLDMVGYGQMTAEEVDAKQVQKRLEDVS